MRHFRTLSKRYLLLLAGVLMLSISVQSQLRMVEIGNATDKTFFAPVNGFYNYGWSRNYYKFSDIGINDTIYKIAYHVKNDPNGMVMEHQQMFIKNTMNTANSDSNYYEPTDSGFVKLFDDNIVWDTSGWFDIVPENTFVINDSNLCIAWKNLDSTYSDNYPVFYSTPSSNGKTAYGASDSDFPLTGYIENILPDIRFYFKSSPEVYAFAPTNLTSTSATFNGTVKDSMGYTITEIGIEYSTASGFANGTGTKVTSGNTKLGDFSIDMPSLTAGTNYYYKVYAVNSYGTSYSNEQRAITSEDIALKSFDMNIIQHVEQLESSKPVSLSIVNEGISISAGGSIDVKIEYPVGIEVINNTIILEEDFNFGDTLNFITDDDLLFNQIGGRHEFLGIISYPDDAYNANDSLFGYILAIDVDFKFKDEVNDTIQVDTFPYQLKVDYTWVPDTAFNTEFLWINQGLSDSVIFIGEDGWYPVECKMSNTIHYDSVYVNSPSVDPDEKGIIYVTQNGKGDGSSWANATNRLQKAIDNVDAKQIWVAEGTYYPNKPRDYNDSLNLSFVLKDSVEMYGGFSGTESFLSDRDPQQNPSILNGNLGDPGVLSDNAINVVFCPDGIEGYTIDGFTISGGNGGLSGGGILALGEGSVENCIIRNNSSDGEGGGIYMQDGSIVNCVIEDNTGDFGGGAYLQGGAEVVSCTIQNNTALNTGGGIYSYMSNIESCLVFNNTSVNSGGGIYLTESFVNNTNVVNNRANTAGGIYTDQNNYIYNTLIANNTAVTAGAISIGNWNVIQHATIANNSANEHGGVYVQDLNSTIANTILWGNTDNLNSYQLYKAADYSLSFINSATTNVSLINWGASTTVEKAITLDSDNNAATGPRFFAPSDTVGFVEDIAIQQQLLETNWGIADSSVCVDSASDNYGISSDMNDTPRPLKYGYDIGAFESIPTLKMSRPSASDISYGQPLDSSKVTGMVYCGDSLVEGNYVMVDSNYYPNDIGMIKATVIFKPATDNFQSEVDSVEIMVNKAKLTVTAEDKYRKPGEDNPELTFIYDGFVFDEQSSVLDTEPTISTTADISSPEGTYPITLSGGSDNHYEFVYVEGTLTVTLSSLSSEIAAAVKVYPNPVKDQLHIETGDDIIRNYQIQSISGTIINKGTISTGIIDVSSLRTGIYFLTINDAVYRIVKQ